MWEKMANIDSRWLYALLIVLIAAALLKPVGLAIVPSPHSIAAYDTIESLPPGSIVWMGFEMSSGGIPELIPAAQAIIRHGFRKDLRFVTGGMWAEAGDMSHMAFSIVEEEFPDKKYGVDWVNIGYKTGGTVLLQSYLQDVVKAAQNLDHYQTPLTDHPLMKEFATLTQADLCIAFCTGSPGEAAYIAHVTGPHKIPLLVSAIAVQIPGIMPYVQAKQIVAILAGMKGAAEYEVLVEVPGTATAGMDAQSFCHAIIILFLILGNIGYFATRKETT